MKTKFGIENIKKFACAPLNKHLLFYEVNKKSLKYGSKKTVVDDIEFASIKEAARYKKLKFLRKKGIIGFLELQKKYELNAGGTHSLKYIADFVYLDLITGEKIVEDCKGFRTKEYKKKRRLMKKVHGITIFET